MLSGIKIHSKQAQSTYSSHCLCRVEAIRIESADWHILHLTSSPHSPLPASAPLLPLRSSSRALILHRRKPSSDQNPVLLRRPTVTSPLVLARRSRRIAAAAAAASDGIISAERSRNGGLGVDSEGTTAVRFWVCLLGVHGQRSGSNLSPGVEAQTLRLSRSTSTSYSSSSTLKNSATAFFSSRARCGLSMKRTVPSLSPGFDPPLVIGEGMSFKASSRGLVTGVRSFLAFDSMEPFPSLAPLVKDLFL